MYEVTPGQIPARETEQPEIDAMAVLRGQVRNFVGPLLVEDAVLSPLLFTPQFLCVCAFVGLLWVFVGVQCDATTISAGRF